MIRRITTFKTQHRWLDNHPEEAKQLCFRQVPHRTTLSRRFKSLCPTLQDFIAFLGVWASALSPEFDRLALIEAGGLFKAHGQSGINRIAMQVAYPEKLRNQIPALFLSAVLPGFTQGEKCEGCPTMQQGWRTFLMGKAHQPM
jgi:hypothetical protein